MPLQSNDFYIGGAKITYGTDFIVNKCTYRAYSRAKFNGVIYDNIDTIYTRKGLYYGFDVLNGDSLDTGKPTDFGNIGSAGRVSGKLLNEVLYDSISNSIFFDGTNNFFQFDFIDRLVSNELTLSVTFKMDFVAEIFDIVSLYNYYSGSENPVEFPLKLGRDRYSKGEGITWQIPNLGSSGDAGGQPIFTNYNTQAGIWYNAVIVLNRKGSWNSYLNGNLVDSGNTSPFYGWGINSYNLELQGKFKTPCYYSNIMIYDRALSSDDITYNYYKISENYPLG